MSTAVHVIISFLSHSRFFSLRCCIYVRESKGALHNSEALILLLICVTVHVCTYYSFCLFLYFLVRLGGGKGGKKEIGKEKEREREKI